MLFRNVSLSFFYWIFDLITLFPTHSYAFTFWKTSNKTKHAGFNCRLNKMCQRCMYDPYIYLTTVASHQNNANSILQSESNITLIWFQCKTNTNLVHTSRPLFDGYSLILVYLMRIFHSLVFLYLLSNCVHFFFFLFLQTRRGVIFHINVCYCCCHTKLLTCEIIIR